MTWRSILQFAKDWSMPDNRNWENSIYSMTLKKGKTKFSGGLYVYLDCKKKW
jgi:hypothetical protein